MSEERIIPDAAEFASVASRATVMWTNVLQSLLVACVVLWVLDIPRQVFNVSFYTEQLLTICLGLTLALAYIADTSRPRHWFDWAAMALSLVLCGYIAVRYANLTDEAALIPLGGLIVSGAADRTDHGSEPPHQRLGLRLDDRRHGGLRLYQPASVRRFPDPLRVARADDRLSRPRHQRRHRLDPAGRGHGGDPLHHPRPGAGEDRRRRFLRRYLDVGHGPLPRRRRQDRGGRLGAVRHDLGQRGVKRAGGRHRHHSDHGQVGLHALSRRRDRGGRLDRRAVDAAGDGRRRLHHGRIPAGALRRGLHRRRHSGDPLLCLPVLPRRSGSGQAQDRRRQDRRRAVRFGSSQVRLALRGADRVPGVRADVPRHHAADA